MMEPVPETERMEAFRSSPVPSLRVSIAKEAEDQFDGQGREPSKKPPTLRRSTDPAPGSPLSSSWSPSSPTALAYRTRNTSPYSRGHYRSRSSASTLAPPISRAQSMPGMPLIGTTHEQIRASSPHTSPHRTLRKPVDEIFPNRSSLELTNSPILSDPDSTPTRAMDRSGSPISYISHNTFPRTLRPASPLRNLFLPPHGTSGTSSATTSPFYPPTHSGRPDSFPNYPSYCSYASSSVPSTPTSARSRSPSISSLETIPDSPDAEEAALAAEQRLAELKADADAADGDDSGNESGGDKPKSGRGRTLVSGFGRDKRKRWSVCGAERRGDLDLETIWED